MLIPDSDSKAAAGNAAWFSTTHWSVVLQACNGFSPQATEALEQLCRTYWYPLYAYARRQGQSPPDAQDLTQAFFTRFLEKNYLRAANRERGRFRSFLLTSFKHFLSHEWEKARAQKRGGYHTVVSWAEAGGELRYQAEPESADTLERQYDRRWALVVMEQALARLRREDESSGKVQAFQHLKTFLSAEPKAGEYDAVAKALNRTAGAVAVAVHRLRQRYADLVRDEIAHTVASPADVDQELRYLIELVAR